MADIEIFVDNLKRFAGMRYFIHLLISEWRKKGEEVQVCSDIDHLPAARLAILHIDSTFLPPAYQVLPQHYSTVVNLGAADISKRRVSRHLLKPDNDYRGPVIVKTNANYGGYAELVQRYKTPVLGRLRKMVDRRRHWSRTGILQHDKYPIFQSLHEVPPAVWHNPALVVERFLEERHGELYALRQWLFFGDREIGKISFSKNPIIKMNNVIDSAPLDRVPESLRVLRDELGFDYGKFDYVLHDGAAVLLDANRTPTYSAHLSAKGLEYAALLAQGLDNFSA